MLAACGKTVLISDYFEYYRLAAYLARYTKQKIGITMGAGSLCELFDEKYYAQLDGGILESFGRLFKNDLKLYIYPLLDTATSALTTVENLQVAPELRKLYEYLVERGCIEQLDNYYREYLPIFSRDVLEHIKGGDASWEAMVPARRRAGHQGEALLRLSRAGRERRRARRLTSMLRRSGVEVADALVHVGVDRVVRQREVAGGEQRLPHVLHVVVADGVGEDRQQVVDAEARRPHQARVVEAPGASARAWISPQRSRKSFASHASTWNPLRRCTAGSTRR